MKVALKLYLPMLADVIGRSELEVTFDGRTAADLLRHLVATHGKRAAGALFDTSGRLDLEVQLLRNRKEWITRENIETELDDGDQITIMVLMGGG
ncbi:MAG TPA: MoaD/ThiS family protein [Polyangia bacterium]|nr:MoaD/ThiS family protein [Polyangia bacterium]